jgi:endonuclease G, mitochondrial
MAQNNRRSPKKDESGSTTLTRFGILTVLVAGLFGLYNMFSGGGTTTTTDSPDQQQAEPTSCTPPPYGSVKGLPRGGRGEFVDHGYYTLSYREDHEQAEWVAYELTRDHLNNVVSHRNDNFRPDPKVSTGSATPYDYRGSGYDRGHLFPAGDAGYSVEAQDMTFFMSNMSPQLGSFNKGIWRELEESARDWARKFKKLYIVTGPVLTKKPDGYIGKDNKVSVPVSYYKVFIDLDDPERKAIGFVIANDISDMRLEDFAVSVDEVERITGLDFFNGLLSSEDEAILERKGDIRLWNFDEKRYQDRVQKWNKS